MTLIPRCRYCGAESVHIRPRPPGGPHYADRICNGCGRHIGFEPFPAADADSLTLPPGLPAGAPLPGLEGMSGKAVDYALTCRRNRLAVWAGPRGLPPDLLAAVKTITDAGWWLSNKSAEAADIKFPRSWFKAKPAPTLAGAEPAPAAGGRTLAEIWGGESV